MRKRRAGASAPDRDQCQKVAKRYAKNGVTGEQLELLFALSLGRCAYCNECIDVGWSLDHIIPRARGGDHSAQNVIWCCFRCNTSKGKKLLSEWRPDRDWPISGSNTIGPFPEHGGKSIKIPESLHARLRIMAAIRGSGIADLAAQVLDRWLIQQEKRHLRRP